MVIELDFAFCAFKLEIFFRGREPAVEGDGSRVDVMVLP